MQALFAIFSSTDHLKIISANMAKGSGTQSHQIFVMEVQTATNFLSLQQIRAFVFDALPVRLGDVSVRPFGTGSK